MNAWPGIINQYDKDRETLDSYHEQLENHFGTLIFQESWMNRATDTSILLHIGVSSFLKYGYCENCVHYLGPAANRRRIYKVTVLNAFCYLRQEVVRPEYRCGQILLKNFYRQIIQLKVNKNKTNILDWRYSKSAFDNEVMKYSNEVNSDDY